MSTPLMEAIEVTRHYPMGGLLRRGVVRALDGVSFSLHAGRTLAVVGESGSGKSTLARIATLLEPPTKGSLHFEGASTIETDAATRRRQRLAVQMVFQNPYGSLNPRKTLGASLIEPLVINKIGTSLAREAAAHAMMLKVGLRSDQFDRYPHQFSGGQRQRIAIARALMLQARVVVADEPVSALDVSIQAQVLNLMMDLQDEFTVAYLFISHDLSVVRHIAHDVLVLYCGRPVEQAPKTQIFEQPRHPYTRVLLAATPSIDPARRANSVPVKGEMPSALAPPPGCAFASRCPRADALCVEQRPVMTGGVACHHPFD
jgi:dipeptide transport system ATP-binding protein